MKEEIKNLILNGIAASDEQYNSQNLQWDFTRTQNGKLLKNYGADYKNAVDELINSGEIRIVSLPGDWVTIFAKA